MKALALIYLILLGGGFFYSWAEYPIMKITTDVAMSAIETDFLREDLSAAEKKSFEFYARWIKENQDGVSKAWSNASASIFYLFMGTLVLNLVNLITLIKEWVKGRKNKVEQVAAQNP